MKITSKLQIDLATRGISPRISAVQNDANTRELEITLTVGGESWQVPTGVTAAVAYRKPDGTRGLYDTLPDGTKAVSISGNVVTAVLAPQALTVAGDISAAVILNDKDLNQLATFPFVIAAAPNPAAGAASDNYYAYSTMEDVSEAVEAMMADICLGFDGKAYETAGEAVRGQVTQLNSAVEGLDNSRLSVESAILSGNTYFYPIVHEFGTIRDGTNELVDNDTRIRSKHFLSACQKVLKFAIPHGLHIWIYEYDKNGVFVKFSDNWMSGEFSYKTEGDLFKYILKNDNGDNTITLSETENILISTTPFISEFHERTVTQIPFVDTDMYISSNATLYKTYREPAKSILIDLDYVRAVEKKYLYLYPTNSNRFITAYAEVSIDNAILSTQLYNVIRNDDKTSLVINVDEIPKKYKTLVITTDYKNDKESEFFAYAKNNDVPRLSNDMKNSIVGLCEDYFNNRDKFTYNGNSIRDIYSNGSCLSNGHFYINCGLFAQMIWLGRDVSDFDTSNYSSKITPKFSGGYYFNFPLRKRAYGVVRNTNKDETSYYGFTKPNNSYQGSYSYNTQYIGTTENTAGQSFRCFAYAADMAWELFNMGCEISRSELEVGDLVFYRGPVYASMGLGAQLNFRNITHVAIVTDINYEGTGFMEVCESTFQTEDNPFTIAKYSIAYENDFDALRGAMYEERIVMCARHPKAFGKATTIPTNITKIA